MNQTVTFFEKSVYGNTRIYPKCDNAKLFAELINKATLTPRELNVIHQLGYDVNLISLPS